MSQLETISHAESDYEVALKALPRLGSSDAVSKRRAREAEYGAAYQRLVRLGVRPQVRGKYRRGK